MNVELCGFLHIMSTSQLSPVQSGYLFNNGIRKCLVEQRKQKKMKDMQKYFQICPTFTFYKAFMRLKTRKILLKLFSVFLL